MKATPPQSFTCPKCGRKIKKRHNLRAHVQKHIREEDAKARADRAAYEAVRNNLWGHCAKNHNLHLLESECYDLWLVATGRA